MILSAFLYTDKTAGTISVPEFERLSWKPRDLTQYMDEEDAKLTREQLWAPARYNWGPGAHAAVAAVVRPAFSIAQAHVAALVQTAILKDRYRGTITEKYIRPPSIVDTVQKANQWRDGMGQNRPLGLPLQAAGMALGSTAVDFGNFHFNKYLSPGKNERNEAVEAATALLKARRKANKTPYADLRKIREQVKAEALRQQKEEFTDTRRISVHV